MVAESEGLQYYLHPEKKDSAADMVSLFTNAFFS